MKKILMILAIFGSMSLSANDFDIAKKACDSGDFKTAGIYFAKACDSGDAEICMIIGMLYEDGEDIKQDFTRAKTFYSKACDGGIAMGCENYAALNEQKHDKLLN